MAFFRQRFRATNPLDWPKLGLLAALLLLFAWNVGAPVLHVWDEARLAVNATEMLRSGDWLITRYEGQPDLWNTKPPLLIWLQAGSLGLFGYSPWAVRLPSVLAALATAGALYRFGRAVLGSRFVGTFAALILATSPGFNGTHVARFGDYDALLTFGLTAAALSWYRYAQEQQGRWLWRGAGWFALALLTKSAAAVLVLPAVAVGGLALPGGRRALRQWPTYVAIAAAFGPLGLFYGLREAAAPGYLAATWFNDWYGRFSQHIVTVQYPWWIYFQRLLFPGLMTWSWLLPVGAWLGLSATLVPGPKRRFAQFAGLFVLTFLVLISVARTRLGWYSAPVYPMAALLCALGLEHLARQARLRWHWPATAVTGTLAVALAVPTGLLLHHEHARREAEKTDPLLRYGYQLPPLAASRPRYYTFSILQEDRYHAVLNFYVAALRQAGVQPVVVPAEDVTLGRLRPGLLFVGSEPMLRSVQQRYYTKLLMPVASGVFLRILGPK
ncbi:ArnT family glycosyltransferase [Hymenobacter ruricola]|uniref:Glycosyltransferase family 39 protein n=1 Tax=Hymenobacter ruricola TaxID=2791023 RepID=A0ABS0IA70_9BACT|nr:glycosyltransferase family 39 protein [Hymenobacter ruricola]MBF9223573.1 glycosyltransferase family 39 protein [Hymenobacter ruricola]